MNAYSKRLLSVSGLGVLISIKNLIVGKDRKVHAKIVARSILYPLIAVVLFLLLWSFVAARIQTSLGGIPGPRQVYKAAGILWQEHRDERQRERDFIRGQKKQNEEIRTANPDAVIQIRKYSGKPTYIDQIFTSLKTVFTGFLIASLIAIPLGLLCGLNKGVMSALNPLIQVFKPISPLAWLPIVTIVISSIYVSNDGFFEKSFIISAITVSLCSIWPSLINTSVGVNNIDKDHLNLAKVFQLSPTKKLFKIVLPSALPLIFAGLRISLGIGWMVLIATEMLAQNPGLGKFIWDEFQNGSSNSLSKIFVAVITIGIIGFFLDRIMLLLERMVTYNKNQS
ncbi:MAG: ABC transporter permease [Bacteroidota bacterium]